MFDLDALDRAEAALSGRAAKAERGPVPARTEQDPRRAPSPRDARGCPHLRLLESVG
jgi:hypothetical protein